MLGTTKEEVNHGLDPCPGTNKYLEAQWFCVPQDQSVIFATACRGEELAISCEGGQTVRSNFFPFFIFTRIRENQIDIRTANYGCLNSAVCPAEGLLTAICSARTSLEVVRDRCQSATSCAVLADDSTFVDDSCPSFVSKSLEVSYACEQTAGK